jgi:hypothetical protein
LRQSQQSPSKRTGRQSSTPCRRLPSINRPNNGVHGIARSAQTVTQSVKLQISTISQKIYMIGIHKNHPTAYFDGARGLAVLLVWLSHSSGRGQEIASWLSFLGLGHIGVMLFLF